jgi:hypothetical protein
MNAPAGQAQSVQERWNPQPWIDDLHQIRRTLETKYANLEWLTKERQVSLDGLFDDAQSRVAAADNHAAFIVGARTVGAGCGHTDGGTPTVLDHTKAVLEVPDCARIRADGTNEISGVIPDYLIPWRADDGPLYKAHLLEKALPTVLQRAMRTYGHSSPN